MINISNLKKIFYSALGEEKTVFKNNIGMTALSWSAFFLNES